MKRKASGSLLLAVMLMIMIVFALANTPFSATFSVHAQEDKEQIEESAPAS
jgi:hypothetical protein